MNDVIIIDDELVEISVSTSPVIDIEVKESSIIDVDVFTTSNLINVTDGGSIEIDSITSPVVEIESFGYPVVEIDIIPTGVSTEGISIDEQLTLGIVSDYPAPYKTFTYSGDNLTQINYYESNLQNTHLRQVTLSYTGNDLTQKIVEDIRTGRTLTTTFTNSGGNLIVASSIFSD